MGVLGLWRLLDPTGKPVPIETLEGKVLAIDVSIWIHQVLQGYQDRRGQSMPNAHLLGLFNRICKLMYFKIKPVFVFDGGVPMLKKNTIASRRKQKSMALSKAQKLKNDLINNLIKHIAVKDALDKKNPQGESSPSKETLRIPVNSSTTNDMFKLPDLPSTSQIQPTEFDFDYESSYDSSEESSPRKQTKWMGNIHNVNVDNTEFKNLPADVRYNILIDLKESRKQSSWGRLHEMPQVLNDFSNFQMKRLLKRRYVQESLEKAEKEMGGKTLTLGELEKLLTEQGINTADHDDRAYRIASDSTTRVIFINDKNSPEKPVINRTSPVSHIETDSNSNSNSNDAATSAQHDLMCYTESDNGFSVLENMYDYDLDEDLESDTELNIHLAQSKRSIQSSSSMDMVMKYMLENSSLPKEQILSFIEQNKSNKSNSSKTSRKSTNRKKRKVSKKQSKKEKANKITLSLIANEEAHQNSNDEEGKDSTDVNLDLPERKESTESSDDSDFIEIPSNSFIGETSLVEKSQEADQEMKESNVHEIKLTKVQELQSESSDSDSDFITIEDVPIPEGAFTVKKEDKNSFEVIFKPEENLKDDLFADVFTTIAEEKPKVLSVETIKENEDKILKSSTKDLVCRVLNFEDIEGKNNIKEDVKEVESNEPKLSTSVDESLSATSAISTSQESVETFEVTSIESSQSSTQISNFSPLPISTEDLIAMKHKLEDEQKELSGDMGKLERQGLDITEQMRIEAQELLRLFGIPYIVAPMEAEAQCAFLEEIDLTDGTITDDSDIWLFGGKCVYKNFFNNNKRVLQFQSCDIQQHFKLTRNEMILFALLVGSDYTTGLPGIGPVTALEVLASFPSESDDILKGLINFSAWVKSGKVPGPGRTSLRNKLKNVKIEKGFPSQAVVQAYLSPTVDKSKEKFTWAKPNLVLLYDYVRQKFGWTKLKFEEVIDPVMKKLMESKTQKGIGAYFKVHVVPKDIEKNLSKRVQSAVRKMGCEPIEEISEEEDNDDKKKIRKKGKTGGRGKKIKVDEALSQIDVVQNSEKIETIPENLLADIKNPLKDNETLVSPQKVKSPEKDIGINKSNEFIPQREKDKANALKNKMRAIEVFNRSKKKSCAKKTKKPTRKVLREAKLSESSDSS